MFCLVGPSSSGRLPIPYMLGFLLAFSTNRRCSESFSTYSSTFLSPSYSNDSRVATNGLFRFHFRDMTSCPCAASTEKTEFPESNDDDDDDDDDLDSLGPISSEEALLALRWRLSRSHELPWTRRSTRRRAAAENFSSSSSFGSPSIVGYFWNEEEDARREGVPDGGDDVARAVQDAGKYFGLPDPTSEYATRAVERRRRRRALWEDEEFRARWYEARWGRGYEPKTKEKAALDKKMKRIVAEDENVLERVGDFAAGAGFDDEAVERMVRDYRRSNARRAKAVRRNRREGPKRGTHRSIVIDENIAGRDDAPSPGLEFGPSATELAAARERRAEKSRKAYASRLANAAAKNSTVAPTVAAKGEEISPKEKPSFSGPPSTSRTAAQAFQRLEAILDDQSNNEEGVRINLSAMVEYVRDILVVKRLTGRKDLLLRILREVLDLRGKCVPMAMTRKTVSEQKKSNGFVFASACRVEILGEFVLSRLEELEQ